MTTESFDFLTGEISQSDISSFADEKVNLKREHAQRYREQVANLRNHLDRYISEHPDIGLVKMLLSGSLAKGTALRTLNDVDVALYVKGESAPNELGELLNWLVEKLRKTYSQMAPEKINVDGPAITISFSGTGIDVDIVPVYYLGDPQWRGYLWDRRTGEKILTSIPQHLDFIRKRKDKQPTHFAQTIRLAKWWARQREKDDQNLFFRSFLIELLIAKLSDSGKIFSDYHVGLEHFFLYIQKTGLKERVAFSDYYSSTKLPKTSAGVVEIFDPVNPENNVAHDMTDEIRKKLVTHSESALDALSYAKTCRTKAAALECWQEVMGSSFNA
jgi:tRNA nucleotidyltransferase (CCA-adding enzyme)